MGRLTAAQFRPYGAAVVSTLTALLFSVLLSTVTQQAPFILFFGAVAFSAGFGGLGPGLLATLLSIIFADYFILPPYGALSVNPQNLLVLVVFAGVATMLSSFYERRKRAEATAYEEREASRVTLLSIGDAVISTDTQARVTFLNPTAEVLTGWRLAEAQQHDLQTVFQIINEETRQPVDNPVFKVLDKGLTFGLANHTILVARDGTERVIDDSAAPIRNVDGKLTGVVLTFRDITERRQIERNQELLVSVSNHLASSRDYQAAFRQVAAELVIWWANWCEILTVADGQLRRQVLLHSDPAKQPLLEALYAHLPDNWNTAQQVSANGQTSHTTTIPDRWRAEAQQGQIADDVRQQLDDLQLKSQVYVPLMLNGQLLGVLGLSRTSTQRAFASFEVSLAEEIGRRLAIALDNARLYQQAEQARHAAERNAARLAQTQQITAALGSALLPSQVAQIIVDQTIAIVDNAYGAMIILIDERQHRLEMIYSNGYAPGIAQRWQSEKLNSALLDLVGHGEPVFIHDRTEWLPHFFQNDSSSISQSLAIIPLRIEKKGIGCLVISFNQPQTFPQPDRALLINLGDKCQQALQRTQLYAAEKQGREQINAILESIGDAFYNLDRELRYVYVNRQAGQLTGHTPEQLIGQSARELFPDNPFHAYAERALAENTLIEYERYSALTDAWLNLRMYPYESGLTVYLQDITARKRAEADAQRSTARLKQFVDADLIGIIFATNDGRILDANDKFLSLIGYSRAELAAGQISWITITPPEYSAQDQSAIFQGEQGVKPTPAEKEYIHKDGHRVPVLIGGALSEDVWVSFVMDLTERKRAERRLHLLTEISTVLASSLDYQTTIATVAQSAVPSLADWCTVHLVEAGGTVRQVALAHNDPAKVAWAYDIQRRYPDDPNATTGMYQVIRSGQAEFYPEITDEMLVAAARNDEELALLREIGYSALIVVPLKVQDRILGAIQLVWTESRQHYTLEDLALAEDIARRAAIAVDNARLYSEVHQERERLQVTLTSIGDAVIATDAQGRITFTNTIAEALTGWTQVDAAGQNLGDVFHIINAHTGQSIESPVVAVLRAGAITNLANNTVLVAKNGTHIPIDDSGAPIRDAAGNLIGVILVFRDIRERRATEMRLETTLQRTYDLYSTNQQISSASTPPAILRGLLTSQYLQQTRQAAVIMFDRAWEDQPAAFEVTVTQTDGPLPGFAANQPLNDSPLIRRFSADIPLFIETVSADANLDPLTKTQLAEQQVASLILLPLRASGTCFGLLALYNAAPHHWTIEDLRHIRTFADQVAIVMDNTRLFEAERQARQQAEYANDLKLKFLAMISHELRTPLTSIKGFTTSLMATDVEWTVADQREFVHIIDEEADKLTDLISQLLDLSQLQAGTLRIKPTIQPLQKIVDIAMTQLLILSQRHHLIIRLDSDLPVVVADPQRIAEVLTNLVGNAVKYAPEATEITITATALADAVKVDVSDQGPGIPVENRERVFEAFQQLERKTSQPLKGAGLGLAICKGLIEAHHGRIWIADEPTVGTTISFTLPTAIGDVAAQ